MEKKSFRYYGIVFTVSEITKYSDFEFGLSKNIWYYNIINFLFYTFTSEKDNLNWEIRTVWPRAKAHAQESCFASIKILWGRDVVANKL